MTTSTQLARKLMEFTPALLGAMNAALRSKGVTDASTMVQLHTLRRLHHAPITFKDLCAHRRVAPATLSRSIEAMVKRGWVERVAHPDDRRQLMLHLTPAGKQEVEALDDGAQAHLAQALKKLSADQREAAARSLGDLMEALSN